jgi:cathepsin X
MNVARTCSSFTSMGGKCVGLTEYPKATISEFGSVSGAENMKKEIYARGPVACGVDADPLRNYTGGVFDEPNASKNTNHIVSIVGWSSDDKGQYWIVRNSWGMYWGEMGYFRIRMGENQLAIEEDCPWAVPASYTTHNTPCAEDGTGCTSKVSAAPEMETVYI